MEQLSPQDINGIYLPLVTPFLKGSFDADSMGSLIRSTEDYIAGYVPCLSSGEGAKMSEDIWVQVISTVRELTKKPVLAGIKREAIEEMLRFIKLAYELGCDGIIIPLVSSDEDEVYKYLERISAASKLPIIIYNTEEKNISTVNFLERITSLDNIIAMKDSSGNQGFFDNAVIAKKRGVINLALLQGLEHQLWDSREGDGYLISLANIEPETCDHFYTNPSVKKNEEIIDLFWKYNLGGNWLVSIKAILFAKRIISSSEDIVLEIDPS